MGRLQLVEKNDAVRTELRVILSRLWTELYILYRHAQQEAGRVAWQNKLDKDGPKEAGVFVELVTAEQLQEASAIAEFRAALGLPPYDLKAGRSAGAVCPGTSQAGTYKRFDGVDYCGLERDPQDPATRTDDLVSESYNGPALLHLTARNCIETGGTVLYVLVRVMFDELPDGVWAAAVKDVA